MPPFSYRKFVPTNVHRFIYFVKYGLEKRREASKSQSLPVYRRISRRNTKKQQGLENLRSLQFYLVSPLLLLYLV